MTGSGLFNSNTTTNNNSVDQNYAGMYSTGTTTPMLHHGIHHHHHPHNLHHHPQQHYSGCIGGGGNHHIPAMDGFGDLWFEPEQPPRSTRFDMITMSSSSSSYQTTNNNHHHTFNPTPAAPHPNDHPYTNNNNNNQSTPALQMLSNNFMIPGQPDSEPLTGTISVDMIDNLGTPEETNSRKKRARQRPKTAEAKDAKYYERRAKNNESAKRSRENKRQREIQIAEKAKELEHECTRLRAMNDELNRKWYGIMNCICQSCKSRIAQIDDIMIGGRKDG